MSNLRFSWLDLFLELLITCSITAASALSVLTYRVKLPEADQQHAWKHLCLIALLDSDEDQAAGIRVASWAAAAGAE